MECAVPSCGREAHAKDLCKSHYMRLWRHGDPLKTTRRMNAEYCKKCATRIVRGTTGHDLCNRCYHNDYYHRNKETEKARKNARRAYLKKATPSWADREEIREFYARCPDGHEVDHIVPLNGRGVNGLHVIWNLQYLPIKANRLKSNKLVA